MPGTSEFSNTDDRSLMMRIMARDEQALRVLYERHSPSLLALCCRLVGDRTEAEQILLDVFWETWQRAERYDAVRSAPLTYLTLLTRSRSLDLLRRRRTAKAKSDAQGAATGNGSSCATSEMPLDAMVEGERSQSVRAALSSLDDEERMLIEACFYDGFTHAELAAKLRQPLGTVKTRIRRGLSRLRLRLQHVFDDRVQSLEEKLADEPEVV